MTTRAIVWTLVIIAVLIVGGVWITHSVSSGQAGIPNTGYDEMASSSDGVQPVGTLTATSTMPIEDFVTQNINTLVPETSATDAGYHITGIKASDGSGTVTYSDGADSYTADFTYTVDADGIPTVTAFIPRSKG